MMLWLAPPAHAQPGMAGGVALEGPTGQFLAAASSPDGTGESVLMGVPSLLQAPTQMDYTTLATNYPNWSLSMSGLNALSGELAVIDFTAQADATNGGAYILLTFIPGQGDQLPPGMRWVQIVDTTDPLSGQPNPRVDANPGSANAGAPFYYGPNQEPNMIMGGAYSFTDPPSRQWPAAPIAPNVNTTSWMADLLLTDETTQPDANGNGGALTIYGGMTWGFTLYEYPGGGGGMGVGGNDSIFGAVHAVPEPGGLVMLGLGTGLAGLALSRRRLLARLAALAGLPAAIAAAQEPDGDRPPLTEQEIRRVKQALERLDRMPGNEERIRGVREALAEQERAFRLSPRRRPSDRPLPEPRPCNARLVLTLPAAEFRHRQPVPIGLEFRNWGADPVTIWVSRWHRNHAVELRDARGREPELTAQGERCRREYDPCDPRDGDCPIRLGPHAGYRPVVGAFLDAFYRLEPGDYDVRVTYFDGLGDDVIRLVSNAAHFRIAAP
jgi:hypothetical protein